MKGLLAARFEDPHHYSKYLLSSASNSVQSLLNKWIGMWLGKWVDRKTTLSGHCHTKSPIPERIARLSNTRYIVLTPVSCRDFDLQKSNSLVLFSDNSIQRHARHRQKSRRYLLLSCEAISGILIDVNVLPIGK